MLTIENIIQAVEASNGRWAFDDKPHEGPIFIMPDGRFLYITDDHDGESEHGELDYWLVHLGFITTEEVNKAPDFQYMIALGIIRCHAFGESGYLQLSVPEPTPVQYNSIKVFLEGLYFKNYTDIEIIANDDTINNYSFDNKVDPDYIISRIKQYYITGKLRENYTKITKQLLLEASRTQLLNKSKNADNYAIDNRSKGKNRYERRTHSSIAATVADYNKINMDAFWKKDELTFGIRIKGETNNYVVTIRFEGAIDELRKLIKQNHNRLEFKLVVQALMRTFNRENVYVSCTCPDWLYSGNAFWSTVGKYNSGPAQNNNGKSIVNPHDSKGGGCKHILLVLANLDWVMKIASVINNYIWYCKDNLEYNYGLYIFPKLYDIPYDKAIQMDLQNYDENGNIVPELASDQDTINLSNALGKRRTQYKKAPQQSVNPRFVKPKQQTAPEEAKNQTHLEFGNKEKQLVPSDQESGE